jgi:ATP-dependent Lon protease
MEEEVDILPLHGVVVYPQVVTPLAVAQPSAVRLIDRSDGAPCRLGLSALRTDEDRPERVGTLALVHRLLRLPDGTLRVAVEGLDRFEVVAWISGNETLRARVRLLPDLPIDDPQHASRLVERLQQSIDSRLLRLPGMQQERIAEIESETDPQRLTFLLAGPLMAPATLDERQSLLEERDGLRRLEGLIERVEALPPQVPSAHASDTSEQPLLDPGEAFWPAAGDLLRIETLLVAGTGRIVSTGQRGRAARDAVQTAIAWVRSHLADLGCSVDMLDQHDLYLHLPATPPAEQTGLAAPLALALAGLLSARSLRPDTIVLAGLSLRGRLQPIPHLREQIESAYAAGIRRIVVAETVASADLPAPLLHAVELIRAERLDPLLEKLLIPRDT